MKLLNWIFTFAVILIFSIICFAKSERNIKKSKEEKSSKKISKPIEVKANVMVLDSEGKIVDDIKAADLRVFEDNKEQKIIYFIKKEPVLNMSLVVDNSGSMKELLPKVNIIGSNIIANLRPKDEAYIVRFVSNDKIEYLQQWTSDKALLKSALDGMFIEGGPTAIIDAIYVSTEKMLEREKQDKSKRYAIFLISDGVELDSYFKLDQMLELFKNTDIQIFQLSFPEKMEIKRAQKKEKISGKPLSLNNLLALETGGAAYNLSENYTDEEINQALKSMIAELQSNYIIGYNSTNQKRNGLPRKLRVEVADDLKGGKRQAFIRESFIVPKN